MLAKKTSKNQITLPFTYYDFDDFYGSSHKTGNFTFYDFYDSCVAIFSRNQ